MNGDSKQSKADFTAALDYMSVIDEVYVWNTALSSDAVSTLTILVVESSSKPLSNNVNPTAMIYPVAKRVPLMR